MKVFRTSQAPFASWVVIYSVFSVFDLERALRFSKVKERRSSGSSSILVSRRWPFPYLTNRNFGLSSVPRLG